MKSPAELAALATQYATLKGIKVDLQKPLGAGTDGSVWPTNRKSDDFKEVLDKVHEVHRDYPLFEGLDSGE